MKHNLLFCFLLIQSNIFPQEFSSHSDLEKKNIQIVLTYWDEVWCKGNLKGVEDFYHPDAVHGKNFTIEGFKKNVSFMREVSPDFKVRVDDIFAKDDKVISRVTYTGTHSGRKMFGQEPLGNSLNVPGIDIFTIKDGKCIEHQHVADHLDLVSQMGIELTPVKNDSIAIVRLLMNDYKTMSSWDIEAHIKNCTDNYLLIENGEIWDMEKEKEYYSKNSKRIIDRKDKFEFKKISIYDSTAYAVYTLKSDITENGELRTRIWNESTAFRKLNGEWKIELIHSTPVEEKIK